MVARVVALLLLASVAWADGHEMYQPEAPEMVGYPNWVLSPLGRDKLAETLQAQAQAIAQKEAEAEKLRADVKMLAAKPELTLRGAVLLVAVGLAVGVTAGFVVGKRL